MSAGKGSAPRPFDIPREVYESNHDRIFGKRERVQYVPPLLPDEADLADLAEAFARIDREGLEEDKHYLCNGKGWLEGPNGEECGPCPDCPLELREKNMPQSMRDILARGERLLAMTAADIEPCAPDCTICESDNLGEPPCPTA